MKTSKLESLVHQLVAAENIIRQSKNEKEIEIAREKIDRITQVCLEDGIDTLLHLDAMAQKILDEKF